MSDLAVAEHASAAAPQPVEPGPLPKRVAETFVSPGALFARFRDRAPWWDVLLIAIAIQSAASFFVPEGLLLEAIRQQLGDNPNNLDPESFLGQARITSAIGNVLGPLIMALLVAAILTVIFRFLMGGEARFRQYFAVVCHAMLIVAVGTAVTIALMVAKNDMGARLSLALLTPFLESGSFLHRVLNGLDFFTLWWVGVLAAGAAALNRKVSWGTAAAVLYGVLLAFAILGAVIGAAMAG